MRLLYAEDEPALSEAVVDYLTCHKYIVDAVYDGADAFDYAMTGEYDGIILDIMMPKKDGLEVLSELRRNGCRVPVLLLTAKTQIEDRIRGLDIESLRKLSNGEQIESVVDIDKVLRYFVVHNYVCNGDSYTGAMVHNYYLYEEDGQMAMIPWDYNLAYGTFQGGNAKNTVNTPIDAPVSGGVGEDRPMWSWILSDESYTEAYHQYFLEFLNTVDVVGIIDGAYELIKSYVEKDPTAFYTYDEFEKGVQTIRSFCEMRTESISMQLENGETSTNMDYVDASGLTMSDMGSMGGGGGGSFEKPLSESGSASSDNSAKNGHPANANRPSRDNMQMPTENRGFDTNNTQNVFVSNPNLIWLAVSVLILGVGICVAKLYKY